MIYENVFHIRKCHPSFDSKTSNLNAYEHNSLKKTLSLVTVVHISIDKYGQIATGSKHCKKK